MAWAAAAAGLLCLVTGLVTPTAALDAVDTTLPVLVVLVALTVLSELTDRTGAFDRLAVVGARLSGGSPVRLLLAVSALAVAVTAVVGLDATAVLLTPAVVRVARRTGVSPVPVALAAVWLANTSSLLLPVSNLTSLLAVARSGEGAASFAGHMLLPWAAAVGLTVVALLLVQRRHRTVSEGPADDGRPLDTPLAVTAAVCCAALVPLILVGVPASWATGVVAAVLVAATLLAGRRARLTLDLVPVRLVVLVAGLVVVVAAVTAHGGADLARSLLGPAGETGVDRVRVAVAGALASQLLTNLPAWLLLAPQVPVEHVRTGLAVLVGTNVGALGAPWASLATLLWADRLRAAGVQPPWRVTIGGGVALALVAVPVCALVVR